MVTTTAAGIIAFWIFEVKTDGQRRLARPFSQPTHNTLLRPAVAHNLQKYDTIAHGEYSRQRRQMAPKFKLYRVRFQNISCQYWLFKIFFYGYYPTCHHHSYNRHITNEFHNVYSIEKRLSRFQFTAGYPKT